MATVTLRVSLDSTGVSSDALNLTVTDTLNVTNPSISMARVSVATTGQVNILTTADNTAKTYVYLKNIDETNHVDVKIDDATQFAELGPGEFCVLPISPAAGLELTADTAACIVEYAFWTTA